MGIPTPAEVLAATERALREQGRLVLCQIVRAQGSTPGKPGWKLLLRGDGGDFGNLGGGAFEALVKHDAAGKLADPGARSEVKRYYFTETAVRGEATGMVCGGMCEVFLEVIEPAPILVICGGGPVGQALARAGDLAGFEGLVVEDRAEFRSPELFPAASASRPSIATTAATSWPLSPPGTSTSPSSPAAGRPTSPPSLRCSARRRPACATWG